MSRDERVVGGFVRQRVGEQRQSQIQKNRQRDRRWPDEKRRTPIELGFGFSLFFRRRSGGGSFTHTAKSDFLHGRRLFVVVILRDQNVDAWNHQQREERADGHARDNHDADGVARRRARAG